LRGGGKLVNVAAMSAPIAPPPLPTDAARPAVSGLATCLGVILALFLANAAVSFLDDSLLLFAGRQDLTVVRALFLLLMLPLGLIAYLMMALAPGVPKRVFLPVALFIPVSYVGVLPLFVYFHQHAAWIGWGVSTAQVLLGWWLVRWLNGKRGFRWPLVPDSRLRDRRFSWLNFTGMLLAALLVVLPALLFHTALSAKLAVGHFTAGFVDLRTSGVVMNVREYTRDDGRKITLVPMSHVGETDFYQNLSESFPADSVVLMEGVSDNRKVVQASSNYSKMAESIGVAEQQQVFRPKGKLVAADLDMSDFSPETLVMLKTAMLVHSKGVTAETMPILMKPTPPGLEKILMEDILTKRNRHLLKVLHEHLPESNHIVIPWGAAHMPEISREIEKSGFKVTATRDYTAIRFGS
jgi:hypothetical protein